MIVVDLILVCLSAGGTGYFVGKGRIRTWRDALPSLYYLAVFCVITVNDATHELQWLRDVLDLIAIGVFCWWFARWAAPALRRLLGMPEWHR